MQSIDLGQYRIGPGERPFLIAEMSGNHNQSLERALAIVRAAADAGAHALKLQTYTADTMTIDKKDGNFHISDPNSLWKGRSLHELYQEAYTPWEWHEPIFNLCKELGMIGFSTPFDETAVDFLEKLRVPIYKIASFENTCTPLLKRVAQTGKPVIMSTGMASLGELSEAVETLRTNGCRELVLLKCTSTYPATPEKTNILTIPHMRELFQCQVGLSDHTMGVGVAVAAVALGAPVIEKHFTLRRADGGVDSAFSMEPEEFRGLATEAERAWQSLGRVHYGVSSAQEEKSKMFRRSIYAVKDIRTGEYFTKDNVRCIRPSGGLAPKHFEAVIGKKAVTDITAGTPLRHRDVELLD